MYAYFLSVCLSVQLPAYAIVTSASNMIVPGNDKAFDEVHILISTFTKFWMLKISAFFLSYFQIIKS